ncbi:MAG TPA: hypothetical protein PKD70_11170 [Saprospiraceae bacterium]|nr:hypothetical protein [Saprospiraceae bacterium]HMP14432.1 hypothetical protein [Saprospiraceae bacterium]
MKLVEQRMQEVEDEIIEKIGDTDYEQVFNLRVEIGMDFLRLKHGNKSAKKIWKQKEFWVWWRWVWHMNDLDILDFCRKNKITLIDFEQYGETQLAKAVSKFSVDIKNLVKWLK